MIRSDCSSCLFLSESFARNLGEIWWEQIPDHYNQDHQGFCFGKEQRAKTNRSSPETLLQLDGAEMEPCLLWSTYFLSSSIFHWPKCPSDAFDKIPFLVRLLATLNRNFTPNLWKFLHLESHLSNTHLKTHPFEVSVYHIIDKRPSLKGWHGVWKTSTPSFNRSEKPIELQNRKLPKRAGPRHVCTTNSHLNDPIGSKLRHDVMVLMCFLHIPQAVWYQTWSYGERDTQQK